MLLSRQSTENCAVNDTGDDFACHSRAGGNPEISLNRLKFPPTRE
jgi:hypothetical protein